MSGGAKIPPLRSWFKLVGVTGGNVPDDWAVSEASLFDLARFPRHRQPTNVSNYERVLLYAVGKGKVFAAQRRAGGVRINQPFGPPGSVTDRWPHEMEVETFAWVPNLRDAPELKAVLPDFMEHHGKKFRQGSHWLIGEDEFCALEAAILAAGEGNPVAPPPWTGAPSSLGGGG